MVIVTQEYYDKRQKENSLAECIYGKCTYEGGYFDLKYYAKDYIEIAAKTGSEPARNAYIGAKVLFSKDLEVADIIARIPIFQQGEKSEKLLSFFSSLSLNYDYFWKHTSGNQ